MDFKGFSSDDFCFFIEMPKNYKREIRKKIEYFGNEVYKNLDYSIKDSYKIHKSISVKDDIKKVWYNISKAYQDRSIFQLCGMTIYIQIDKIGFKSIIRGGSFRDNKSIGALYEKISRNPEAFIRLLGSFNEDYFLKAFRRMPLQGDKIRPGLEKWETIFKIRLQKVNYDLIEFILAILEQNKLPGIQILTGINPSDAILKKPDKLVKKAVKCLEDLYKFLSFIES